MDQRDTDILRHLADEVRTISETSQQKALRERWKRHNALDPDGPIILTSPEGAWQEILPPEQLRCEDPIARGWEENLRMRLYHAHVLKDDQPVDATFGVPWLITIGDYGVPVSNTHGENRGSYKINSPLKTFPDDFERLRFRELSVDRPGTEQRFTLASEVFDGILDVRRRGSYWWTLGLTWEAIKLVGLETLMLLPYDGPEHLHRLMGWLRDEHSHFITWFENEGLLTDQNENDYVGSGGIGYTDELPLPGRKPGSPARLIDRWGFAESQETVGVSPEMFAEFILPYQIPLLERFGLNCYGCCEPVDGRWDAIKAIPRLRRVSVSPWADVLRMAQYLGRAYIFSRKPNPAPLCVGFDESALRTDLAETFRQTKGCVVEVVMKDTHTVEHDVSRLPRWVQIAREEAEAHA